MDEAPGTDPLALGQALPGALPPHRSTRRKRMGRWWQRSALVGVVFALGLLQGSRAALGPVPEPPAAEPAAFADVPGADRKADTRRGHFYRPEGSDAVRPALRLRPSRWTPAPRVALACPDPAC